MKKKKFKTILCCRKIYKFIKQNNSFSWSKRIIFNTKDRGLIHRFKKKKYYNKGEGEK